MKQAYNAEIYRSARKAWVEIHQKQVRKGFEKYPEPLNPDSWTEEELIIHAMEENIDQFHYLTALLLKARAREDGNSHEKKKRQKVYRPSSNE